MPFHRLTGPASVDVCDRMDRVAGKIGPAPRDARLGGFARIARAPCIGTKPPADLDASRDGRVGRTVLQAAQAQQRAVLLAFQRPETIAVLLLKCDHTVDRSEEHTSELQSLLSISYAVLCLKKKTT